MYNSKLEVLLKMIAFFNKQTNTFITAAPNCFRIKLNSQNEKDYNLWTVMSC